MDHEGEGDMVDHEEGDMVDYEGEGDTDVFSLQSLRRGIFFVHQVIKFIMCGQL